MPMCLYGFDIRLKMAPYPRKWSISFSLSYGDLRSGSNAHCSRLSLVSTGFTEKLSVQAVEK